MEISYQEYSVCPTKVNPVQKVTFPFLPDLSRMEQGFRKRRRLRNHFPRFLDLWSEWLNRGFLTPRVSFVRLHKEDKGVAWPTLSPGIQERVVSETEWVFPAVWSLGSGLDDHSADLRRSGHSLEALLFDMAGGLVMLQLNRKFKQWLGETLLLPGSRCFLGEVLPGREGVGMEHVPEICRLVKATERSRVSVRPDNFLFPLKSGCTVLLAGRGKAVDLSFMSRCEPCLEDRCLYFQFGLCFARD